MPKVCIIRAPGTNCDAETKLCIEHFNIRAEIVHIKKIIERRKKLSDYDALVIPGGFSFGDRIRAGSVLGSILRERFHRELEAFNKERKPILGICNGFQVLIEAKLIKNAALLPNSGSRFECRWANLKKASSKSFFLRDLPKLIKLPIAHGEGRFFAEKSRVEELEKSGQISFYYAKENGEKANMLYPYNPNGSVNDIAGVVNEKGNMLALMPHPERAFFFYTRINWHREKNKKYAHGYYIFKNLVEEIS